jgi:hypothetical protein
MAERAEQKMAALFEGLRRMERLGLLGRLEKAGGQLYRALAADEKNVRARGAPLKAAVDEERNGELLRQMSTPKQNCEQCGKPLSAASGTACFFQCTFLRELRRGASVGVPELRRRTGTAHRAADTPLIHG